MKGVVNMKEYGAYYLGLDIGTNSIGWAVTDLNYKLLKFNGKAMWGVRLFDEAKTASERRQFRSARRRLQRRKERIHILQELFSEEVSKVDMGFYQRLKDSRFHQEDKLEKQMNSLFQDLSFNDTSYYVKYPTIYHLRNELMKSMEPHDVRLVYLAIHHIIKHRGHFLFEGDDSENALTIRENLLLLKQHLQDEYEIEITINNIDAIEAVLKNKELTITDRKRTLMPHFSMDSEYKKMQSAIVNLIAGGTESLANLYMDESLKESDVVKVSFANFDGVEEQLESVLEEKFYLLELLKAIYDWGIFSTILDGHKYLSEAKIAVYDEHKEDLKRLKRFVKKYCPEEYNNIFKAENIKGNYCSYVGISKSNIEKKRTESRCTQEDLLKYLENKFKNISVEDDDYRYIIERINNRTFLPKQINSNNGVIPNQVHKKELKKILENAENYLPFLKERDESGYSVSEKIIKLFEFRIPYYVGPLNDSHKSENSKQCWIVKKEQGKIYPWNFEEKVDVEASASDFITRMTNKCTYLIGEDVLPKNSLLYSRFMVLNELNNLKINGEKINVELKQKIFNNLFLKGKKVTGKALRSYLRREGIIEDIDELSGFDIDFKSTLTSEKDFKRILGGNIKDTKMVEEIIRWIVLFGDDKKILKSKIKKIYGTVLSDEQMKEILKLKYTGWGRLSEKLLKGIGHTDRSTGEISSIITMLWDTNNNLMELLTDQYDFLDAIDQYNAEIGNSADFSYETVDQLYVSPAVKRSIWQTIQIVKELIHILGHDPKKVFVETTRSHQESKRTVSRKNQLLALYKNCKEESREWCKEISDKWSESDLRSKKLYLYYTQMGKCMYTGRDISLDELWNKDIYDIDHIYPRSKVKDDSLQNNLVLVDKRVNSGKQDIYPLKKEIRDKNKKFWYLLKTKGFITTEKYNRLIRNTEFSVDELGNFIARQVVETSQSTKAVAEILKKILINTGVVYVKAQNVSAFRQENDFPKVREVNDYHHAKDAYLNIVVGNVYDSKFTRNPAIFLKKHPNYTYSLNKMYNFNVTDVDGTQAWIVDDCKSLNQVKAVMKKNNILFTRYAYEKKGELFDQMPMKKGKGQIPLKNGMPIELYGGYNKAAGAYFILVEHTLKNKRVRSLETVLLLYKKMFESGKDGQQKYCKEVLGLTDAKVLLDKVKFDSLFCVDGFYMHISSRTNDNIRFKGANQLCISPTEEKYVKKIVNYINRIKEQRKDIILETADQITKQENLHIYDLLTGKIKFTIYGIRLSAQIKTLETGREKFIELEAEEQCKLLYQLLLLFACNSMSADLRAIGGVGQAGYIQLNKKLDANKKYLLVNQSPTGLFEQKIDLLKL